MLRCPKCGSTAQVRYTGTYTEFGVTHTHYACGCGHTMVVESFGEKLERKFKNLLTNK